MAGESQDTAGVPRVHQAIAYLKADATVDEGAVRIGRADSPVLHRFTPGLIVSYVVDMDTHYELIQQRHLEVERIDENELHAIGIANLTRIAADRTVRVAPSGNVFAVMMGGDFEASLVLVDDLWERAFRPFVGGDYAVALPARDVLAFCDDGSPEGVGELELLVARVFKGGDHLLSSAIHARRAGRWELRSKA